MKWIAENPDKLKPPLGAKTIFQDQDFMVTVVGGPNTRTDYHVNPTEEFFFQLKGTVTIRIQHEGKPHDISCPRAQSISCLQTCRMRQSAALRRSG